MDILKVTGDQSQSFLQFWTLLDIKLLFKNEKIDFSRSSTSFGYFSSNLNKDFNLFSKFFDNFLYNIDI